MYGFMYINLQFFPLLALIMVPNLDTHTIHQLHCSDLYP